MITDIGRISDAHHTESITVSRKAVHLLKDVDAALIMALITDYIINCWKVEKMDDISFKKGLLWCRMRTAYLTEETAMSNAKLHRKLKSLQEKEYLQSEKIPKSHFFYYAPTEKYLNDIEGTSLYEQNPQEELSYPEVEGELFIDKQGCSGDITLMVDTLWDSFVQEKLKSVFPKRVNISYLNFEIAVKRRLYEMRYYLGVDRMTPSERWQWCFRCLFQEYYGDYKHHNPLKMDIILPILLKVGGFHSFIREKCNRMTYTALFHLQQRCFILFDRLGDNPEALKNYADWCVYEKEINDFNRFIDPAKFSEWWDKGPVLLEKYETAGK